MSHSCEPAIVHIPTKHCELCGKPAIAGSDYCIPHTADFDYCTGTYPSWAYGLAPKYIYKPTRSA